MLLIWYRQMWAQIPNSFQNSGKWNKLKHFHRWLTLRNLIRMIHERIPPWWMLSTRLYKKTIKACKVMSMTWHKTCAEVAQRQIISRQQATFKRSILRVQNLISIRLSSRQHNIIHITRQITSLAIYKKMSRSIRRSLSKKISKESQSIKFSSSLKKRTLCKRLYKLITWIKI